MLAWLKDEYAYIHGTFHNSSVIVWSRLNVMLGIVWVGLQGVDVSPLVNDPKYMVYYVIFSNVVNELFRRNGATYDKSGTIL